MSIPATEVEARWNAATEPFTAVVREVRDWDAATPCEGWDALDLLDHVIAGQRDFAARQGRVGSCTFGMGAMPNRHFRSRPAVTRLGRVSRPTAGRQT